MPLNPQIEITSGPLNSLEDSNIDYLLAYRYFDGNTAKFLNTDLLVNDENKYYLHISFRNSNSFSRKKEVFDLEGTLPAGIGQALNDLLNIKELIISPVYDDVTLNVGGLSTEHYSINYNNTVIYTSISGLATCQPFFFSSGHERVFYIFHQLMKDWTEKLIKDVMESNTVTIP